MAFTLAKPPTPKTCPVCGRMLITRKQHIEVIKGRWIGDMRKVFKTSVHRKRKVCTHCKVAVVLHRLPKGG